jgi:hypothetical protein
MWAAATQAEQTFGVPLSPELVLVSPELRELALRELALPHERNGVKPQSDLLNLARSRAVEPHPAPSLVRVAGAATVRAAVFAAVFVTAVAGVALGLTLAPGETEPRLAPPDTGPETPPPVERAWRPPGQARPARVQPASRGIGTAAVHDSVSRPSSSPAGLTRDRQPVWSLDALARATGSELSLSKRKQPPLLRDRAVPLRLRESYISCGRQRWIAVGARWMLSCEQERGR